ncbi:MAG TPA: SGNH/GDSL hydrolase family protein [Blastocatellia bacterium]|nr:SGNH/GDSL hydrolase family protein [Blastocatellia bacterium]
MTVRDKFFSLVALLAISINVSAFTTRLDSAKAEGDFALRDGDRVLFYGDSITEQRLYTTYVEHYVLTHYPERRVTFINTGWGGDQVTRNECVPCRGVGGLARIKRDVIDHHPTVVTLLFGMNDGRYYDFDEPTMKVYVDGLTAIIHEIKANTKARIYVMTPTVYDGTRNTPWSHTSRYNDVLDRYSEAAKQLAAREQLPVIDLHVVTVDALTRAKEKDSAYTFLPDGVHPQEDGQLVMAAEILRAWGAPASGVEIKAPLAIDNPVSFRVGESHTFAVSGPLAWPEPMPSDKLRAVWPQITEMGTVTLRTTGLSPATYKVSVDGGDARDFTADELTRGIALNPLSKKAHEDSKALAEFIRKRADWFFMRWRQIEVPYAAEYKSTANVVTAFDSLIDEMAERARKMAAPHKYEITISRVQ